MKKKWTVTCEAVYVEKTYEEWSQPLYQFALPILESMFLEDAATLAMLEELLAMPVVDESFGNLPKLSGDNES